MTLTDRSRIIEYRRCPRARWWAYEWGRAGKSPAGGISRAAANVPLTTGIFTHVGIADLLQTVRFAKGSLVDTPECVDHAVALACSSFAEEIHVRGIDVETGGDPAFTAREQEALIEAMIRAWAIVQLPVLLSEYEVIDVEREELMHLADDLTLQSRPDALLRRRDDGSLCVLSLKTAASWDDRQERSNRHDDQGLSEVAAVESRLTKEREGLLQVLNEDIARQAGRIAGSVGSDWQGLKSANETLQAVIEAADQAQYLPTRVDFVLMNFLLKGERRQDRSEDGSEAGPYRQHSPLIRGYCRQKTDPVTLEVSWEYAWSYYWTCSGPHESTWANGRKTQCNGGKRHGLGNSWSPFNVWEIVDPFRVLVSPTAPDASGGGGLLGGVREFPPGIKGWIEMLAAGVVQPEAGPCLEKQFITPVPYFRQEQDIEDWVTQATQEEIKVAENAEVVRQCEDPDSIRWLLNTEFPQNRRACDWPTRCPFTELCHETPGHAGSIDPLELGGVYRPREPHHEEELRSITPETPTQPVTETTT